MSRLEECLQEMGEHGTWWTTSQLGARMNCPTSAARTALERLHELGFVRRHDNGSWQKYPVRLDILDLLRRDSGQEWTAHGVATELSHLNLTEAEAATILRELQKGDYVEVWYSVPAQGGDQK